MTVHDATAVDAAGPGRPPRGRRRFAVAWVSVLVVAACVWWGIHPPGHESAYRHESAQTLKTLGSQVETARLWVDGLGDGSVTRPAVLVALTETDTDADTRTSSYASLEPPDPESRDVRRRVTSLADEVVAALGELRVAARAGRWHEVLAAEQDLERLGRRLGRLQRSVAP